MEKNLPDTLDSLLNAITVAHSNWDRLTVPEQDVLDGVTSAYRKLENDAARDPGNPELLAQAMHLIQAITPVRDRIRTLLRLRRETEESAGPEHLA